VSLRPTVPAIGALVGAVLPERFTERWRQFIAGTGRIDGAYRLQRGLYMPAEITRVAGARVRDRWSDVASRLAGAEANLFRGAASTLEGDVARLDTQGYLSAQLLRDTDVMSMAHGLEVRMPLVDHELVAAVWPDLGAFPSLMRNKRLLHDTLRRPLPHDAVNRPKQGFTLPFATWMRGELQPFVCDGVADLEDEQWIARGAGAAVVDAWTRGGAHWSRPWALGVLGQFLDRMSRSC
jgi:asparagine synthetase B (glutamine-hydrolysing)